MANTQYKNSENDKSKPEPNLTDKLKYASWTERNNLIISSKLLGTDYNYKHQIVWKNVFGFLFLHSLAFWGLFILISGDINLKTLMWVSFITCLSSEGVTVGAHRLFTHRSFKATTLLKIVLIICQTVTGQNSVYVWARDHRLHHRYSDTDADPHNAKRGFWFSHMTWLMLKKHPYVKELGKRIDMSDLEADWTVMFQKKYYYQLYFFLAILIPVTVPYYYFGESLRTSILVCYFLRYVAQLHGTWLVNSAAHLYGTRPYDKNLQPVESWFVSFISLGEGWHNYHHAFPWDYKAAELSMHFNFSASLIRFLETLGLAYDLKTASPEMVEKRIIRTGDGTHYGIGNDEARSSVTAMGILHPFNPTYNVKYQAPEATLKEEGLPLYHEKDVINSTIHRNNASG